MSAKKKAIQVGDKVLIPLGVAAGGGAAANQLPQNQRSSKKSEKVFKSGDQFVDAMCRVISKMDADEAELYTQMVVAGALEEIIQKNQRTLQRHVNDVAHRVIEDTKRTYLRSVAKNADPTSVEYAKALATISKEIQWDPDLHPRDRTGRFRTSVHIAPGLKPLSGAQAKSRSIPEVKGLGQEDRARYHQEYQQVAQFLNAVAAGGNPGDHNVTMKVVNMYNGQAHNVHLNGLPKPKGGEGGGNDWDPKTESIVELDAHPQGLTLGGASFALANALGRPLSSDAVNTINRGDAKFSQFANEWTRPTDPHQTNARLYNDVGALSTYVEQVAPRGSGAQVAARFGRMAAERGPEAEKVFGPHARRAAYRYRGTEKKPSIRVQRDYDRAIGGGQRRDLIRSEQRRVGAEALSGEQRDELRARVTAAVREERERRWRKANAGKTDTIRRDRQVLNEETDQFETKSNLVPLSDIKLTNNERQEIAANVASRFMEELNQARPAIDPDALGDGRDVLIQELRKPDQNLYGLHLDAGHTPPSEGFLIDKEGNLVTQAIGFGDDHYLPFNLKHLAKLHGGEYVRSRSVGGPTSEDIYTGLMAGAAKITVVSRSGTFTVDFEQDFKGKRRYNDKAARMVNRYQRLLDSVQSETVDREPIPRHIRNAIVDDVRSYSEGLPASDVREEIKRRETDYRLNPDLSGPNKAAVERYLSSFTAGMNDQEARRTRAEVQAQLAKEREFKYRLNGEGYGAALDALEEQFPYYIRTSWVPKHDPEGFEAERDSGYVEPGKNRPTQAAAGYWGVRTGRFTSPGEKFSAGEMDYQRAKYQRTAPTKTGEAETPKKDEEGNGKDKQKEVKQKIEERKVQDDFLDAAVKVWEEFRANLSEDELKDPRVHRLMKIKDEQDFRKALEEQRNVDELDRYLHKDNNTVLEQLSDDARRGYEAAAGRIDRKPWDPAKGLIKDARPYTFPDDGPAYEANPNMDAVQREVNRINATTSVTGGTLATMTDRQLENELEALRRISAVADNYHAGMDSHAVNNALSLEKVTPSTRARELVSNKKDLERHVKNVQQMRALNLSGRDRENPEENVTEVTQTPNKPGDPNDRREQVEGFLKYFKEARADMEKRGLEIPEHLDLAIRDGEITLGKKGHISPEDAQGWMDSDEYKKAKDTAGKHMFGA